jgi:hypothetical protein
LITAPRRNAPSAMLIAGLAYQRRFEGAILSPAGSRKSSGAVRRNGN